MSHWARLNIPFLKKLFCSLLTKTLSRNKKTKNQSKNFKKEKYYHHGTHTKVQTEKLMVLEIQLSNTALVLHMGGPGLDPQHRRESGRLILSSPIQSPSYAT
jgi:hypothetical protein